MAQVFELRDSVYALLEKTMGFLVGWAWYDVLTTGFGQLSFTRPPQPLSRFLVGWAWYDVLTTAFGQLSLTLT